MVTTFSQNIKSPSFSCSANTNSANYQSAPHWGKILDMFFYIKKGIMLNHDIILKGLVQIVTLDGRLFVIFHNSWFETAFGAVMSGLKLTKNFHNTKT